MRREVHPFLKENQHKALRGAALVLICLLCYNAWLLIGFLLTPINATLQVLFCLKIEYAA